MNVICKKVTSRPRFSRAKLVIRKKIVSRKVRRCLVMMVSIFLETSEVIAMGR